MSLGQRGAGILLLLSMAGILSGNAGAAPGAVDRSDIRIVSSFVSPGEPVPEQCRREARVLAASLVRFPRPASWHWVLVCDEAGWERFLRLSGRAENDRIYASTDLASETTYVRGHSLLAFQAPGSFPDQLVAHELAHVRLRQQDEAPVETLARSWYQQLKAPP